MKNKKYLVLAAIMLIMIINVAVVISAARNGSGTEKEDDESTVPQSTVQVSGSTIESTDWMGWQQAKVVDEQVQLCSDAQLTDPMDVHLGKDAVVIVCQKQGTGCLIRSGSEIGWVPENALIVSGEPVVYSGSAAPIPEPADISDTEVGEKLDIIADQHGCVGVQIAIINNGCITHHYEYGYQDKSSQTPLSVDSKLRIASLSKVIVGMGVLSMHDMEILSIDEDVSSYWGADIRNPNFPDDAITFRSILTHTSSLTDFGYSKRATSALAENLSKPSSYMKIKPGDINGYKYNNSAICAAGAIAGCAADKNFDQYVREYFFAPLGIDASFHAGNIKNTDKISVVYNAGVPTIRVQDFLDYKYYGGAGDDYSFYSGGMLISACDYAKLACILINGGEYDQMYYLRQQSVDQMFTEAYQLESYNQCLVLRHRSDLLDGRSLYYHNGNMAGVYSLMCVDPESGDGMVVITNGAKEPTLENAVYNVCGDLAEAAVQLWSE